MFIYNEKLKQYSCYQKKCHFVPTHETLCQQRNMFTIHNRPIGRQKKPLD